MDKNFGNTLFLVGSPFQCLCMLEAINYFNIDSYDVIVTYSDNYNLSKIDALLRKKNILYAIKNTAHILYGVLPFIYTSKKKYQNIFIGDFNAESNISIAYILAKFKAKIYFLDDGNQALSFFSTYTKKKKNNIKVKFLLTLYRIIGSLKCVNRPTYFTIYNVSSTKYEIIKNPLNLLLKKKNMGSQNGVYIIGTNSEALKFKDNSYEDYLISLYKQIKLRFPEDNVIYCPHRRDPNFRKISSICKEFNIKIFDTKIAVEFDFIEANLNPKYVVGFGSNALYTLKLIYPDTTIETVIYSLQSKDDESENKIIANQFYESGIFPITVI